MTAGALLDIEKTLNVVSNDYTIDLTTSSKPIQNDVLHIFIIERTNLEGLCEAWFELLCHGKSNKRHTELQVQRYKNI